MFKVVHLYDLNIHKLVTKRDTQSLYQILQQFHQQQKKFTKSWITFIFLKEGSSIMANSCYVLSSRNERLKNVKNGPNKLKVFVIIFYLKFDNFESKSSCM